MNYQFPLNKSALLAVLILIPLSGCVLGSHQYDRTFKKEAVMTISPAKTTRREILQWLGPPAVLARFGGEVRRPSSNEEQADILTVESKVYFKYFAPKHSLSNEHVVYYYFNQEKELIGFMLPLLPIWNIPITWGVYHSMELWVLINRTTGLVTDYVFLERREKRQ